MKVIEHIKEDVTDKIRALVPTLKLLQLGVQLNKVTQIPETDKEREYFALCSGFGNNPSKQEYYSVTDKLSLIRGSLYLLQHKENIILIWNRLNESIVRSEHCCICGESNVEIIGSSYKWLKRRDYRVKTCDEEECKRLYQLLKWYFKRLINKISKAERKFICSLCKKEYHSTRKDSKFCSIKCRVANHRLNNLPHQNQAKLIRKKYKIDNQVII